MHVPEISVAEAHARLQGEKPPVLVDVREQDEWDIAHVEGAVLVPLSRFVDEFATLLPDRDQPLLVLCHHGMRSAQATAYLLKQGYSDVTNIAGGIDAWSCEADAGVARY